MTPEQKANSIDSLMSVAKELRAVAEEVAMVLPDIGEELKITANTADLAASRLAYGG